MFCFFHRSRSLLFFFFFFNDTATTEIYTLSLHDALPILAGGKGAPVVVVPAASLFPRRSGQAVVDNLNHYGLRSEEHTSELQSPCNLVCRLLLEKKKKKQHRNQHHTHRLSSLVTYVPQSL